MTSSGAEDRSTHAEGDRFWKYFRSLLKRTGSCFERDVLRDSIETLWDNWKIRAEEFDKGEVTRLKFSDKFKEENN